MKIFAAVLAATIVGSTYLVSGAITDATKIMCISGFRGLNFSLYNFAQYPEYFRNDSTITVAEAGTFKGPTGIEEYVHFSSTLSPFVSAVDVGLSNISTVGLEGDICVISVKQMRTFEMEKKLVGTWPPVEVASLNHFFYNVTGNYIQKWHVFFEVPWTKFTFTTLLNTPKVHDLVCNTMTETCGYDVDSTGPCQKQLDSLPSLTDVSYFDGNSMGCRILHATMARENSYHCAHISFNALPDPSGRIICQNSDLVDPRDLFDDDDVAAFRAFYQDQGIDPGDGYRFATAHSKSSKQPKSAKKPKSEKTPA